ncbi:hypothetical protein GYMLUDRAFT_43113 [Collybiopsis luxurians FD-317 M1]|uniref:Protein kinase domain-containing protein n=1 Tax=Collybiopsis luxurians FD-317 M1 TaxID=944289 RepID=A0A0D0BYX3_9AGAR|nr:hypothetical protein GYMLUDRAFT_43113 [Collybiopsis luxurians FD-317 M1]
MTVAQVATEKGIYHYDLHPGNFLVTFVGSTLAVSSIELLDWGLATLVQKPVTKGEVYEYYKEDIRSLS